MDNFINHFVLIDTIYFYIILLYVIYINLDIVLLYLFYVIV
jgi:hypothetical protein